MLTSKNIFRILAIILFYPFAILLLSLDSPYPIQRYRFHKAIKDGDIEAVNQLFIQGEGYYLINSKNHNAPALQMALLHDKIEIANFLINKGADLSARGCKNNVSIFYVAAFTGHIEIAELIRKRGVVIDVDEKGSIDGDTALMCAAFIGNDDAIEYLIKLGANVNITNKRGETALDQAIERENVSSIKILQRYTVQYKNSNKAKMDYLLEKP